MHQLSGTDSLFLAGETPAWHQHVAGLSIIDPTGVPDFCFDNVVASIARRLPAIPKLTWKLKAPPLHLDRADRVPDTNCRRRSWETPARSRTRSASTPARPPG